MKENNFLEKIIINYIKYLLQKINNIAEKQAVKEFHENHNSDSYIAFCEIGDITRNILDKLENCLKDSN